jgi:hypothetical protein
MFVFLLLVCLYLYKSVSFRLLLACVCSPSMPPFFALPAVFTSATYAFRSPLLRGARSLLSYSAPPGTTQATTTPAEPGAAGSLLVRGLTVSIDLR